MANTLGNYNPIFYAQEALIQLHSALGMANRVYRGYEAERRAFDKGDTINIRRPSTFVAASAPAAATDLLPENVTMTLDQWKEVKFGLTDKELTYTQEQIIKEHIAPAARALALDIDTALNALYYTIPWNHAAATGATVENVIGPRKVLFNNGVPLTPGDIALEVNGQSEAELLALSAFTQQQGAGDQGVSAQMSGSLGRKFGVEVFANQNVTTHTTGSLSAVALLTNGTFAKGVTVLQLDAATLTGTIKKGDTFTIAGHSQSYAVQADVTASGNALANVTISPALAVAVGDGIAVTVETQGSAVTVQNLAFHRNAFALVLAPLPDTLISGLGVKVATVSDPITQLSLRSRLYYEGANSKMFVALDVLYGVKTLDPNMAVRSRRAT